MPTATNPTIPLLALLTFAACTAPTPKQPVETWEALEAPIMSPPGQAPLAERIQYWENKLVSLPVADLSEARLRLGELYLQTENAPQARLSFYAALGGPHSVTEGALAEYGIARSYLLDEKPGLAKLHLMKASALEGPEGQEASFLLSWTQGRKPEAPDASFLERLRPYLGGTPNVAEIPLSAGSYAPIARGQWGARPLRGNHSPMGKAYRITIHHTAEPMTSTGYRNSIAEVRGLQKTHQQDQGWADVGYHFLIDRSGRVFEGRDLTIQGAHAGNSTLNRGNIGICLLGNFHPQPDRGSQYMLPQTPSQDQYASLAQLVDSLRTDFKMSKRQVWAHQDLKDTACPGVALKAWVGRYRN